jgi:hypothetical protein
MSEENPEQPKWSFNWKLAVVGWVLFTISLFCPFFSGTEGSTIGWRFFEGWSRAAKHVLPSNIFWAITERNYLHLLKVWNEFNYLILVLANLFMLSSMGLVIKRVRQRLIPHVLLASVFFLLMGCLLPLVYRISTPWWLLLDYGYVMWIFSFGLLALSIRENKAKQEA